jgi:hypothetical protein
MTENKPKSIEDSVENSMATIPQLNSYDVVDLGSVFRGLARCKWFILMFAIFGLVMGVRGLKNFSPKFEALMIVSPSSGSVRGEQQQSSFIKGAAKSFGLSISGVQSQATNFDRLRYSIGSIPFVQRLDKEYDIIRRMNKHGWDAETQSWKVPKGRRFEIEQKIRRLLHLPTWQKPSLESFAESLKTSIQILPIEGVPFFKLSYQNSDRETAHWFLKTVFQEADNFLRRVDRRQALVRKEYVVGRLDEINIVEQRQMLISMLASEEQRLMLLNGDLPYAADVIEPVFVSSTPTAPILIKDFGAVVMGWVIAGIALSLFYVLLRTEKS